MSQSLADFKALHEELGHELGKCKDHHQPVVYCLNCGMHLHEYQAMTKAELAAWVLRELRK